VHVPVVSCLRRDWPLRREAADMLARCLAGGSVDAAGLASLLVFLDDVQAIAPLLAADAPRLLAITLVDHNELKVGGTAGGGGFLGAELAPHAAARVVEIVDHHLDAGRHAHVTGADRLVPFDRATMSGVGSTCTLVAQRLLDDADEAAAAAAASEATAAGGGAAAAPALDARLAEMLLSTIALDTAGLDEAAGKTTPLDVATVRRLRAVICAGEGTGAGVGAGTAAATALEPRAVFARLMALKQEPSFWRSLSVAQALGFDFKSFALPGSGDPGEFGTSSVMASLDNFLSGWEAPQSAAGAERHAARLREVAAFASERGLAFAVIMSAVGAAGGGSGLDRGLALVAAAGSRGARLVDNATRLLTLRAPELQLVAVAPVAGGGGDAAALEAASGVRLHAFRQGNGRASRKQLVPLLLAALTEAAAAEAEAAASERGPAA
jgi:inorganic pyrophosphatase/exopolyphosphatase